MKQLYSTISGIIAAFFIQPVYAQNELYINGTDQFYNNGALIYVNGNIYNNDGLFTNTVNGIYTGTVELTGNWINTSSSKNYVSIGTERFSGSSDQLISGTWNGTSANQNQFYNLKINKPAGYVSLAQNTNVNAAGSLEFESTGGIVRTATTSSANTGDYAYYLYLQNPSTSAMSGYSWPSGTTKYIEGKLKRQVNSASAYEFPIGFQPSIKDGMEAYQVKFNTAPSSTGLAGYIRPAIVDAVTRNVLCDVGTDPNSGISQFPTCAGPKDGLYDLYYLDQDVPFEWIAIPDNAVSYNYDITFYPGTALDNLTYYTLPGTCDGLYAGKRLRVLTKDGEVGGSNHVGPDTYYPFLTLNSYVWCDFDNNTLSAQTSFSAFRIYGTSTYTSTTLPVELINFILTPVDNSYFLLNWQTASEFNNAGFEAERSEDAVQFTKIGWVNGHGTTSSVHAYQLNDKDVIRGKTYYYRLKQIDTDGHSKYSEILEGRLEEGNSYIVSEIYPNPVSDMCSIKIYSPENEKLKIELVNILGQQIQEVNYDLIPGWNIINLDAHSLAAGTYLLNLDYRQQQFIKKLVKN